MFSFENKIIAATIAKLLNGEDYRQEDLRHYCKRNRD